METKYIIRKINVTISSKKTTLSTKENKRLKEIKKGIKHSKNNRWLLHWLAVLVDFLITIFK
jgi:hypothetical protein